MPVPANKQQKLEALFLNRVTGLQWYYFEIDLSKNLSVGTNQRSLYGKYLANTQQQGIDTAISQNEAGDFEYSPPNPDPNDRMSTNRPQQILWELLAYTRSRAGAPRDILRRIFDENEPGVLNRSEAHLGSLGWANRFSQKRRGKIFLKKLRSKQFKQQKPLMIMAEGDSWFHFPRLPILGHPVRDIIDHLMKKPDLVVRNLASGGDWLSNMVKTADYIQELDRIHPDAFLFSGGGNDMLGGHRLAKMIRKPDDNEDRKIDNKIRQLLNLRSAHPHESFDRTKYARGLAFLTDDFFNFINVTMSQYFLLLSEIFALGKFQQMKFITHGYDYVIPTAKRRGHILTLNYWMNRKLNSGKWLHDPMMLKGIFDEADQQAILYTMVYEINEMLISLAQYPPFKNLYHIDCRGVARGKQDWYDEIHLRSPKFKEVAELFYQCILAKNDHKQKVYRVS
ncbi:MAG: hypothetical protein AAFR61_14110 [Bacteroidota bacterium]